VPGIHHLDATDRRLIDLLLENARQTYAELASQVSMSATQCHRRISAMEKSGAITGYSAVLDPATFGYPITIFVTVELRIDDSSTTADFEVAVRQVPEVLECHCLLGESDYLLRVVARDLDAYQRLHADVLGRLPGVSRITSHIRVRAVKEQRHPPLPPDRRAAAPRSRRPHSPR